MLQPPAPPAGLACGSFVRVAQSLHGAALPHHLRSRPLHVVGEGWGSLLPAAYGSPPVCSGISVPVYYL